MGIGGGKTLFAFGSCFIFVAAICPMALYLALRFSVIFLFGVDWHQLYRMTAPGQVRRPFRHIADVCPLYCKSQEKVLLFRGQH